MKKSKILYIRSFKLATCKEWELVVPRFSLLTIVHVTFPRQPNFPAGFSPSLPSAANIHLGKQTE